MHPHRHPPDRPPGLPCSVRGSRPPASRPRCRLLAGRSRRLRECAGGSGDVTTAGPPAHGAARGVKLTRIGTFSGPTYVAQAPGDPRRLFVVEQAGRIRVVRDGRVLRAAFLDIRRLVVSGGEQGLLSMAFAPDYASSGRFYVDYTDVNGEHARGRVPARVVARPRGPAQRAARAVPAPAASRTTTAGSCSSGPTGCSTSGSATAAAEGDPHGRDRQRPEPRDAARQDPADRPACAGGRPIASRPATRSCGRRGARPAIYAWGLRNPWRFSFDRATGDMVDRRRRPGHGRGGRLPGAGNRARRELRLARVGGHAASRTRALHVHGDVKPVLEYTHAGGNCSITGGYVIRDPRLPALAGRYVYGDFCAGDLFTARLLAARLARPPRARPARRLALLLRRGHAGTGLRRLAGRAGLPARPALTRPPRGTMAP